MNKTYKEKRALHKKRMQLLKKLIDDDSLDDVVGILRWKNGEFQKHVDLVDVEMTHFSTLFEYDPEYPNAIFGTESAHAKSLREQNRPTIQRVEIKGYIKEISYKL